MLQNSEHQKIYDTGHSCPSPRHFRHLYCFFILFIFQSKSLVFSNAPRLITQQKIISETAKQQNGGSHQKRDRQKKGGVGPHIQGFARMSAMWVSFKQRQVKGCNKFEGTTTEIYARPTSPESHMQQMQKRASLNNIKLLLRFSLNKKDTQKDQLTSKRS